MGQGKGGKNKYWWTEGDARKECMKAMAASDMRVFTVKVPVTSHVFEFVPNERVSAAQWVSSDCPCEDKANIAHITMSFDRLELTRNEDKPDTCHASLKMEGIHYTVRTKESSDWIGRNAENVLPWVGIVKEYEKVLEKKRSKKTNKIAESDQKFAANKFHRLADKKIKSDNFLKDASIEDVIENISIYSDAQKNSLHCGLNGDWNSGNKSNTSSAKQKLGFSDAKGDFKGSLRGVADAVATVGAQALKQVRFELNGETVSVTTAQVTVGDVVKEV